jgi:hypothetical protein
MTVTQLPVNSADVTPVRSYINDRRIVVILVYISGSCAYRTKKETMLTLTGRLKLISQLAQEELLHGSHTKLITGGDFSRHNPLWYAAKGRER